jgi:hypothetical protein
VGQAIASLVLALIIAAVLAPLIQLPFPMLLVLWAITFLISLSVRREDKNGSHDTEE